MTKFDQLRTAGLLVGALRSQWWTEAHIRKYQDRALVAMMRHCLEKVPFYRNLKLRPESITKASDLNAFPVIRKRDVQLSPDSFIADGVSRNELFASRTSGSSGYPTTTYFDRNTWLMSKYALKMRRIAATTNLLSGKRVLIVSEQKPERLTAVGKAARSGLRLIFSAHYLSIHTPTEQHLSVLNSYRPNIIYAFPSYLDDLITLAERSGSQLPSIAAMYTSSEVLTRSMRARIEIAFSGRVFDIYGSTEFKEVAWQCRGGCYHLNFESVFIEPMPCGSSEPVVLSTLCNVAMPLLRFDIGDRAQFGSNSCRCGRASLTMLSFEGREGDMIMLPHGRRVSPYLLTSAIEAEESILQYRIGQNAERDFRIDAIVRRPGDSLQWRDRVCAQFKQILGNDIAVSVQEVSVLERAASGKRSVFRKVPPPTA